MYKIFKYERFVNLIFFRLALSVVTTIEMRNLLTDGR